MSQPFRNHSLRRRLVTARHIQVVLAALWILDGALQLQPFMFTRGFAEQVIAPAGQGQPGFVSVPVGWAAHLITGQPVLFDALFASVQLALGMGLLWRRTVRIALAGSVLWSLGVWYLGEGLGGLAGGRASLLTGAPGGVLIYAVLAVAAFPRPVIPRRGFEIQEWPRGGRSDEALPGWTVWAWSAVWVIDATLGFVSAHGQLAATIAGNEGGAPVWLSILDRHVASELHRLGPGSGAGLYALELLVGLLPLLGRRGRVAGTLMGLTLLAVMWVVGQSLGQLYSGQATDPNTAVPLAVLALGILSASPASHRPRTLRARRRMDPAPPQPTVDRLAA